MEFIFTVLKRRRKGKAVSQAMLPERFVAVQLVRWRERGRRIIIRQGILILFRSEDHFFAHKIVCIFVNKQYQKNFDYFY